MTDVSLDGPPRVFYRPETPWGPLTALAVTVAASLAPVLIGLAGAYVESRGLLSDGQPAALSYPTLASPFFLAQMIAGQLLSLGLVWAAAGRRGARVPSLRLGAPQASWLSSAGYGAAMIVLIGPIEILLYRLAGVGLFTDGRWLLDGLRSPLWWAVAIAAVVLAPLWEELTFRGFLLSALAKSRLGFWPGAVLSTLLWTMLHAGYSWPGLASVFMAGLALSAIMKHTGSMRAVVVAHGIVNAFSLSVTYLFAP
jgi:membrane protease YdiL (CAAX protease family)